MQIKLPLHWILSIWKAHIGFQQICNYYSGNAPVWEFPETLVTSIGKFLAETKVRFRKVTDIAEAYSENPPIRTSHTFQVKFRVPKKAWENRREACEPSFLVISIFVVGNLACHKLVCNYKRSKWKESMRTITVLCYLFL